MTHERILAIDVGLGTADIMVFDPRHEPENSVKLVVPSRTQVVAREIRAATERRAKVVFHGPTMGGGPSGGAMRDHLEAGLPFLATETAALTFDDDLERLGDLGLQLIDLREVGAALRAGTVEVRSADVDLSGLGEALRRLGVDTGFSGACIAVQDHGYSPAGSNRVFRFELWRRAIEARSPIASLFYAAGDVPPELTRLRAAAATVEAAVGDERAGAPGDATRLATGDVVPTATTGAHGEVLGAVPRTLAADTGPAALYGALPDGVGDAVLVNVGNGHTLCIVARDGRLAGVFEHHTRRLDGDALVDHLRRFLTGRLDNDEVRDAGGHGAVIDGPVPAGLPLFVTGPRRALLDGGGLEATFPAPFGDMMMTGPAGLIRAYRERYLV